MIYKEVVNSGPQSAKLAKKIHEINDNNPTISSAALTNKIKEYLMSLNLNGWFSASTFDTMDENYYSVVIYCEDTDEVICFTITD